MPKNLLLADDSITIQKVVGITFANEDFTVTCVDNGEDALSLARELNPDIIVADVTMPRMNGYDVCEAVKGDPTLRHIPVLLLAGTFEAFDENRARQARADGHLSKPFESQALINKVKELTGGVVTAPAQAPAPARPAAAPAARPAAPAPAARPMAPGFAGRPPGPGVPAGAPRPGAAMPPAGARPPGPGMPPFGAPRPGGPPGPARPSGQGMAPRPPGPGMPPFGAPRPGGPMPPAAGFRPPGPGMPGAPRPGGPLGPGGPRMGPVPPAGGFRPPGAGMPPPAARPMPPAAAPRPAGAAPMAPGRPDPYGFGLGGPGPAQTAPTREEDFGDVGMDAGAPGPARSAGLDALAADAGTPSAAASPRSSETGLPPAHAFVPAAGKVGHKPEAAAGAPGDGGEALLRDALSKASREVIERVVWEVVPQLAETIIRENLDRLVKQHQG